MNILLIFGVIAISMVESSLGINCYSCDSSSDFSHVNDAKYCVKMTGIFDGKLGTKRFCSSRDRGDYCEYIQRPGDPREYRSCVFTCSTHGCNSATKYLLNW